MAGAKPVREFWNVSKRDSRPFCFYFLVHHPFLSGFPSLIDIIFGSVSLPPVLFKMFRWPPQDTSVCLRNYCVDGTMFWNQFFIAALRDSEAAVINYVGVQCKVQFFFHHCSSIGLLLLWQYLSLKKPVHNTGCIRPCDQYTATA